jgi:hypothetical protein
MVGILAVVITGSLDRVDVAEKTAHLLCLYQVIRYRGVLPHINRGSSPRIKLSRAFSLFVTVDKQSMYSAFIINHVRATAVNCTTYH